jgi:transglutaminase-like putative cysteine protease
MNPKVKVIWDKDITSNSEQKTKLWEVVQKCTGSPKLISFVVKNIIDAYNVPGNDPIALAKATQKYVQEHIKFFRESPERWQTPKRTLIWRIGDCDDKTILIACILRSFRIPVRLVFVRFNKPSKTNGKAIGQAHVFPCVHVGGKWVALESVRPVPYGFNPIKKLKEQGAKIINIDSVGDKVQ